MATPEEEKASHSLTYEETPIIDTASGEVVSHADPPSDIPDRSSVTPEAARVFQEHAEPHEAVHHEEPVHPAHQPPPVKAKSGKRHIGTALFVVLLFGLGVWLSTQLRSFFAPTITDEIVVPTVTPFALDSAPVPLSSPSGTPTASQWQTYQVMNGRTRTALPDVSYQLPASVAAPTCDNQSCSSQGTNLPGGTRFTVAARGQGQLLPDFRGAILTDAGGREFTMKQGVFGGAYAYEYTGEFTGRTGGGYTFTRIRGLLLPVSDTLAVEFNHFAPASITSDFAKDDALFDEIIRTFKAGTAAPTPAVSLPATTPVASPTAF